MVTALPVPQRDTRPAYFFVAAANAAIERRRGAVRARDASSPSPGPAPALVPGAYVGQLVARGGPPAGARVPDLAFEQHLQVPVIAPDTALVTRPAPLYVARVHIFDGRCITCGCVRRPHLQH